MNKNDNCHRGYKSLNDLHPVFTIKFYHPKLTLVTIGFHYRSPHPNLMQARKTQFYCLIILVLWLHSPGTVAASNWGFMGQGEMQCTEQLSYPPAYRNELLPLQHCQEVSLCWPWKGAQPRTAYPAFLVWHDISNSSLLAGRWAKQLLSVLHCAPSHVGPAAGD